MKLSNIEQAMWAVIEIAMKETGKTKAADAIKANAQRIEATTEAFSCALYKTPGGQPAFKATSLTGGSDVHLNGFKLLQKAASLDGKADGTPGGGTVTGGGGQARSDSAERNRSVGLMRRKSG